MTRKKKSNSRFSWGFFLSVLLHGSIIGLVFLWGIKHYSSSNLNQPINVSLSGLDYKGSAEKMGKVPIPEVKEEKKEPEKKPEKKEEVKKEEPEKEEVKKEEKEPEKKEPEKKEIVKEEKEEVKKEEKKPEPEKKAVPLETEKVAEKEKKKKEKKKEKKEVKKKKETKKAKKQPAKKEDDLTVARKNVISDLKRKNVIDSLKKDESQGLKGSDKEDVAGNPQVNRAILNVYNDAIWRKIKPKFRIPPNIPRDGSLTANVFFRIDDKGNVSGVKVNKSSGNVAFDNFCINTIISSSPLPAPPKDIAKLVISEGFEIPMSNEG